MEIYGGEVRVSCVGREGRGDLVVWLVKFLRIKACWTAGSPLVRWVEGCAQIGYAKSVKEVRAVVGAIVAAKNNLDCAVVRHGWGDRFRSRHPHLTLRMGLTAGQSA